MRNGGELIFTSTNRKNIPTYREADDEQFLDAIHLTLQLAPGNAARLEKLLAYGGSVWMATDRGLPSRVDPTATAAFERSAAPNDAARAELKEAWANAWWP
jgi:hypothetical protein